MLTATDGVTEFLDSTDPASPAPSVSPHGKCDLKGIVLANGHVWDEPRLRCTRCGYTKPEVRS